MQPGSMDTLIERFLAWANAQPDIQGALVLGSRARLDRPADRWSDLDLVLVADDPQPYLADAGWLEQVAPVWLSFLEPTATGGLLERRVLFAGALDVDIVLLAPAQVAHMLEQGLDPGVRGVLRRGMRVLLDKRGLLARLQAVAQAGDLPPPAPPSEADFMQLVHDVLYHVVWTAKKLRRGELWVAHDCCDGYLKRRLLTMLAWHARAAPGSQPDTWHAGRFVEQWADPRAVAQLRHAFAHYSAADLRRALLATLQLFHWLAGETATRLGYRYPLQAHEQVSSWVRSCLEELNAAPG